MNRFGATPGANKTTFRYPDRKGGIAIAWTRKSGETSVHSLARGEDGMLELTLPATIGDRYRLVLDGQAVSDPFARFLPEGVGGPAELIQLPAPTTPHIDLSPTSPHAFYEVHIGTFTPEGTYRSAIEKLPLLAELGVDAIELMPLAAFGGRHGWGYDGVAWLAPHAAYGRPEELIEFVDAAHRLGLAVIADVVLNHFGPAGNWLPMLDPECFDRECKTPWGAAPDFGNPVMRWLAEETLRTWLDIYGMDGVRLDATHAIVRPGEPHVLSELSRARRSFRPLFVAEDERNDPMVFHELGLSGVWADDFHHAVHVLLTGDQDGYYQAYPESLQTLARTLERGWFYEGQHSVATGGPRGAPLGDVERARLVLCLQNHDQIGNRALGERLHQLAELDSVRAATALMAFLPSSLLMFQGQEWAASSPFLFFTDHEGELGEAIRKGRREEFASFAAFASGEARDHIPDPQAESTFASSTLRWEERNQEPHRSMLELHRRLLELRRTDPVLRSGADVPKVEVRGELLIVVRRASSGSRTLIWNCGRSAASWAPPGDVLFTTGNADGDLAPQEARIFAS